MRFRRVSAVVALGSLALLLSCSHRDSPTEIQVSFVSFTFSVDATCNLRPIDIEVDGVKVATIVPGQASVNAFLRITIPTRFVVTYSSADGLVVASAGFFVNPLSNGQGVAITMSCNGAPRLERL